MTMEITNSYAGYAAQSMAGSGSTGVNGTKKKAMEKVMEKEMEKTPETIKNGKAESTQDYLRKLQKQVPYMTLEIGSSLSMSKDKRRGVLTVNPKLLERMRNDPEAEKEFTQRMKDIERAERTATAYYNSLGGCVERTSHWYMDENGKYYHFAYTVRDDKLNKKIREETKKNSEKFIERTREKAAERKKKLKEADKKKQAEAKQASKEEAAKEETSDKNTVPKKVGQLLDEKLAASKDGTVYLNPADIQMMIDVINGKDTGRAETKEPAAAGANLDLQV